MASGMLCTGGGGAFAGEGSGWTDAEAKEYARTGEVPPQRIGLVQDDGFGGAKLTKEGNLELRDPLGDRGLPDEALTPRQAAKEQKHFREALAAQQEQQRQEIEGAGQRIEAQREAERVEAEGRVEQERLAREAAENQRVAEQQREAERIRVAQLEWNNQASTEERAWIDHLQKCDAWLKQIPEAHSWDAWNATLKSNPGRAAQLQQEFQRLGKTVEAGQKRLAELGQTRQLRQHAVATHHAQAMQQSYRQYSEAEDSKAEQLISRDLPQYKTKEGRAAISRASRDMLKNLGLTDAHINQVWADGAPINLRSAPAQAVMAKAAAYDLAMARSREVQKKSLSSSWPAHSPGVGRPRGAGDLAEIRGLEKQLNSASGTKALKIATKLTQLRRGVN
jgi:hypothetical protein